MYDIFNPDNFLFYKMILSEWAAFDVHGGVSASLREAQQS